MSISCQQVFLLLESLLLWSLLFVSFYNLSSLLAFTPTEGPRNPCNPSPCGANAICKERNGAGSCSCLPEYQGDPYTGCRPECVVNSDCGRTRACVNNKCRDPCPGACGSNADCRVANHSPTCTCIPGYSGDPLRACYLVQAGSSFFSYLSLFAALI